MAERHSQKYIPFELNGVPELVRRGFLDVTVQITPAYTLRLIGVHLKSKLPSPEGQDQVRRLEAALLRRYIDKVLLQNPRLNLLVYGDFNDTRDADCFKEILGGRTCLEPLNDLPAQDSGGQRWTHYWQHADVYSRIDYLLANRGLKPELVPGTTKINDSPQWRKASDHRLLYTTLIPCER
jgi:endonuclease/exonuclease/phosphatase family metal-dependent hydrolase